MEAMGSICTNSMLRAIRESVIMAVARLSIRSSSLQLTDFARFTMLNMQMSSLIPVQANLAVELALLNPGDTFMGLDLSQGGHLTHGSPVNASGILYNAVAYGLNPENWMR